MAWQSASFVHPHCEFGLRDEPQLLNSEAQTLSPTDGPAKHEMAATLHWTHGSPQGPETLPGVQLKPKVFVQLDALQLFTE